MNQDEFFRLVRDHWWKFATHGWQNLTMGGKGSGILAISFEEDGRLSFPSKMGFLPEIRRWEWDVESQQGRLITQSGAVDSIIMVPVWKGQNLVMTMVGRDDTYVSSAVMEPSAEGRLWAPDALLKNSIAVTAIKIPLQIVDSSASDLEFQQLKHQAVAMGYGLKQLTTDFSDARFFHEAYQLLIDHPEYDEVCLSTANYQQDEPFFVHRNADLLTFVIDPDRHNYPIAIIGHRSLVIDFLGEFVYQAALNEIDDTDRTLMAIIHEIQQHFTGRMNEQVGMLVR
ncbi:hypothetical protein [Levilactobacillus bambusae]|uniref:Uncharacterized protein n=1 Tax=Levilactobacillus bambusae TaxID=2024736 RepID=A0A2V1N015_9LACO|nr:hypothetical protein [Levilactobacillus bambusae]PWF99715.1 hypothetical protein DCM90_06555 [Levilactobacillus bambusae]